MAANDGQHRANRATYPGQGAHLVRAPGEVLIDVPRDRDSSFEPQIVKKRQRRLNSVDKVVLSLHSQGMTTGDISAHFADIYGASVSKETASRITDKVMAEMTKPFRVTFGDVE